MNLLANIFEANALIAWVLCDKLGEYFPQRSIFIKVIFELLQLCHQRIPAAFSNADGKHNEEGIETTLLDDHAMLCKILRHNAGGDTHGTKITFNIQSRRNDCCFDWIEHIKVFSQFTKVMPACIRC